MHFDKKRGAAHYDKKRVAAPNVHSDKKKGAAPNVHSDKKKGAISNVPSDKKRGAASNVHSDKKRGVGLESLTDLVLYVILTKLDAKDIARVACVNTRLREFIYEDDLWSKVCLEDLDMTDPINPYGNPCISFKVAYKLWREAFHMYPWCLVKRVKRCWDKIKTWLTNNFPEAKASLLKGANEVDIQELENTLKVKLPLPTRILYRLHNGQTRADDMNMMGLIGGHCYRNYTVNVSLLPLKWVITLTQNLMGVGFFSSIVSKYIVLAANSVGQWTKKVFLLNCANSQLYVWSNMHRTEKELIPCVPDALINSVYELNGDQQHDAMLLWLEEHGRRLQSGIIKLHEEGNVKSIDYFPKTPTLCSTYVTNGLQVDACAMFVPELTTYRIDTWNYQFLSSVRVTLLPQGCISNGMSFNSCQSYRRHWIIREYDVVVFDEGIEINLPVIDSSNREFVYKHLRRQLKPSGSMEAFFTFVPGRVTNPMGSPFEVIVPRHPLELPDYIF